MARRSRSKRSFCSGGRAKSAFACTMRPATLTLMLVPAFFGLLFCVERMAPLRRRTRSLLGRLVLNLAVSALAFAVAAVLVRPAAMATLKWSSEKPFGLIQFASIPPAVQFIVAFPLMDLTFYW